MDLKRLFRTITFGETRTYVRLTGWMLFDSLIATIPVSVMMVATYLLVLPAASPDPTLDPTPLWVLSAVLVAQTLAYAVVRRKTYVDVCVVYPRTGERARIRMGEHLKRLSMGFFSTHDAGDLTTVLIRDFEEMQETAASMMAQVTVILIRLVLAIVVFAFVDWRMMVATLIVIPLALPFAIASYRMVSHTGTDLLKTQERTSSLLLEYVGGIQTLKAFNQAGTRFEGLRDNLTRLRDASKRQERAGGPVAVLGRMVLTSGMAVVMAIGTLLLVEGTLHPFWFMVFLLCAVDVYEPIMQVFTFIATLSRTDHCAQRIDELWAQEPHSEPTGPKAPASSEIELDDVHFGYRTDAEVLHGVSLDVPNRTLTALVGPSGSGKSTITKLAARFWDVGSGQVRVGGVPVGEIGTEALLSQISVVFQDVYLFHDTIESNIRMGRPDATHEEVVEAARKAACHDFIMALPQGYETVVGEGGSTLSGGEKQRVSIARALLKDAPIILLDEATSSLDPENEVLIQRAINQLVADKTVIIIAHRLQSVRTADQIVVLDEGRVRESGTHEQLVAEGGLYARLWEQQQRVGRWRI